MPVQVNIPINKILQTYGAWAHDIAEALTDKAVVEIRKQATQFGIKTGNLRKGIGKRESRFNDGFVAGSFMPHTHLLEYGHAVVRNGEVVGHAPAYPFVEPAEMAVRQEIGNVAKSIIGDVEVKG